MWLTDRPLLTQEQGHLSKHLVHVPQDRPHVARRCPPLSSKFSTWRRVRCMWFRLGGMWPLLGPSCFRVDRKWRGVGRIAQRLGSDVAPRRPHRARAKRYVVPDRLLRAPPSALIAPARLRRESQRGSACLFERVTYNGEMRCTENSQNVRVSRSYPTTENASFLVILVTSP